MGNTYNYLKTVFHQLQQESNRHPAFIFILLALVTIPLSHATNNVSVGILAAYTLFLFRKHRFFRIEIGLLLPVILYFLMLLSLSWSIYPSNTVKAISKELTLFVVPVCFMMFPALSGSQKRKMMGYYSYILVLFSVFYLLKAIIRYIVTKDSGVFFYHELVTKDVNAIHVSVYVAVAFFGLLTRKVKSRFDFFGLCILLATLFLLASKNIILVLVLLLVVYSLFYSKQSPAVKAISLCVLALLLIGLSFVGNVKDRFREEYETVMTDNTINEELSNGSVKIYNVSINQAWNQQKFTPNHYFPGTAFRVYQFRIFTEMLREDPIFFTGYGLNASYLKIEQKSVANNLFLGSPTEPGYQKRNFHNQYIQNFADLGIFGLLLLLAMLALNLKNALKKKDFTHISFAVLMISLFLTESFLWRQRGVAFFILMYCLFNAGIPLGAPKKE